MSKFKRSLEIIFFILINILQTGIGILFAITIPIIFSKYILTDIFGYDFLSSNKDWILVYLTIYSIIIFLIFKISIFPLLYCFKNKFPFIGNFLNKLRTNSKFMWITLEISILLSIPNFFVLPFLIALIYSIFIDYIIFLLFFPPIKNKNFEAILVDTYDYNKDYNPINRVGYISQSAGFSKPFYSIIYVEIPKEKIGY